MHWIPKNNKTRDFRTPESLDVEISQFESGFLIRAAGPLDPSTPRPQRCLTEWASGQSFMEQMRLKPPLKAVLTDETISSWRGMSSPRPVTRRLGDGIPGPLNSLFRTPVHAACILRKAMAFPLSDSPMCFCSCKVSRQDEHEELHLKR